LSQRTAVVLVTGIAAVLLCLSVAAEVVWWDTYWGQYVGQNVLPPSVWTLFGVGLAHLHGQWKADQRHQDLKDHVTEQTGNG
jgi:hypothetical protein